MLFPTQDPVVLEIVSRSKSEIDGILSTFALVTVNQHQMKILDMGIGYENIEVPAKCADTLEVVTYQLHLYRNIANMLMKLPKAAHIDEQIMFYISLTAYLADVIYAFVGEVRQDGPKAKTSKWRSAHLDFHIALALQDSAFTLEHQKIALKKINRTWAQFREKKLYKRVQALTYEGLHRAFCTNDEDMCGGGFQHKNSCNDIIAELLINIQNVHAPETDDNAQTAVSDKGSTQASEVKKSQPSRVQATVEPVASSTHMDRGSKLKSGEKSGNNKTPEPIAGTGTVLSDIDAEGESDSACVANVFQLREDSKKSTKGRKANRKSQPAKGTGKGKNKAMNKTMSPTDDSNDEFAATESVSQSAPAKGKAKRKAKKKAFTPKVQQTDESDDELDANESSMASVKGMVNPRAVHQVLAADSPDDELQPLPDNESYVDQSAVPNSQSVGKENITTASQTSLLATDDDEKYRFISDDPDIRLRAARPLDEANLDPHTLPSVLDEWSKWNRIAFEQGNSHVFLKLATWMLLRFRQLANLDMDADVNGVVIPENPRTMAFDSDDQYLEALGMERLYSAIVHMESRPRFLSHLFHALGNVANTSDLGESNPRFWSITSPPPVISSMMSDTDIPWLSLKGEDTDVADEFDGMVIVDDDEHRDTELDHRPAKRKRTSSVASPAKKDGGRGPSKRPKEIPSAVPFESRVPDTIEETPGTGEDDDPSPSAVASGIISSAAPLEDGTSPPSGETEDAVMTTQYDDDNRTCPVASNDATLLSQGTDIFMDANPSTMSIQTETQMSEGDEALVDVAEAESSSITPTQVIIPSQPSMDDEDVSPSNLSEPCVNN
ncbi:hypothetical protein C8R48DRAFT_767930 [Suillus tomentosus]|nr:hypothetical protein C8R48DRAFT_767930 [Suillus tomentosus]